MKSTFEFIILSLQNLLDVEFYLFPLALCAFLLIFKIVYSLRGGDGC